MYSHRLGAKMLFAHAQHTFDSKLNLSHVLNSYCERRKKLNLLKFPVDCTHAEAHIRTPKQGGIHQCMLTKAGPAFARQNQMMAYTARAGETAALLRLNW